MLKTKIDRGTSLSAGNSATFIKLALCTKTGFDLAVASGDWQVLTYESRGGSSSSSSIWCGTTSICVAAHIDASRTDCQHQLDWWLLQHPTDWLTRNFFVFVGGFSDGFRIVCATSCLSEKRLWSYDHTYGGAMEKHVTLQSPRPFPCLVRRQIWKMYFKRSQRAQLGTLQTLSGHLGGREQATP